MSTEGFAYELSAFVYATYKGHLYEAKILKRRVGKKGRKYYLKYSGFGNKSNAWQAEGQLYPYTEENREVMLLKREEAAQREAALREKREAEKEAIRQEKLRKQEERRLKREEAMASRRSSARSSTASSRRGSSAGPPRKRGKTMGTESETALSTPRDGDADEDADGAVFSPDGDSSNSGGRMSDNSSASLVQTSHATSSSSSSSSRSSSHKSALTRDGRTLSSSSLVNYAKSAASKRSRKKGSRDEDLSAHAQVAANGNPDDYYSVSTFSKMALLLPLSLSRNVVYQQLQIMDKKYIPLPRTMSVHKIVEAFIAMKEKEGFNVVEVREYCDNLELLFSSVLPQRLLYSLERYQFKVWHEQREALAKTVAKTTEADADKRLATYYARIYGAEHLLRLLVLLPELLRESLHHNSRIVLKTHTHLTIEFVAFLDKHQHTYFTGTYAEADPSYMRMASFAGM